MGNNTNLCPSGDSSKSSCSCLLDDRNDSLSLLLVKSAIAHRLGQLIDLLGLVWVDERNVCELAVAERVCVGKTLPIPEGVKGDGWWHGFGYGGGTMQRPGGLGSLGGWTRVHMRLHRCKAGSSPVQRMQGLTS